MKIKYNDGTEYVTLETREEELFAKTVGVQTIHAGARDALPESFPLAPVCNIDRRRTARPRRVYMIDEDNAGIRHLVTCHRCRRHLEIESDR